MLKSSFSTSNHGGRRSLQSTTDENFEIEVLPPLRDWVAYASQTLLMSRSSPLSISPEPGIDEIIVLKEEIAKLKNTILSERKRSREKAIHLEEEVQKWKSRYLELSNLAQNIRPAQKDGIFDRQSENPRFQSIASRIPRASSAESSFQNDEVTRVPRHSAFSPTPSLPAPAGAYSRPPSIRESIFDGQDNSPSSIPPASPERSASPTGRWQSPMSRHASPDGRRRPASRVRQSQSPDRRAGGRAVSPQRRSGSTRRLSIFGAGAGAPTAAMPRADADLPHTFHRWFRLLRVRADSDESEAAAAAPGRPMRGAPLTICLSISPDR